jgi:hypothetical protein
MPTVCSMMSVRATLASRVLKHIGGQISESIGAFPSTREIAAAWRSREWSA